MDFPAIIAPICSVNSIHSIAPAALGGQARGGLGGIFTNVTWPVANTAFFIPFRIPYAVTAIGMQIYNGTAVSGNLDAGIYSAEGTKIVSSGSIAQAGTSAVQTVSLTATVLAPGLYYMALVLNNATGVVTVTSASTFQICRAMGMLKQATAFPLPATAAFVALSVSTDRVPFFAVQINAAHPMTRDSLLLPCGTITPWSLESVGALMVAIQMAPLISTGSLAWVTANDAVLVPFTLASPITIKKIFCHNGATVSGNIDLGIYDESLVKLLSTGSTAQAGVNGLQVLTPTATKLGPGNYYLALAIDNTTATIFQVNTVTDSVLFTKTVRRFAASFPLGTLGTEGTISRVPLMGLGLRGTI